MLGRGLQCELQCTTGLTLILATQAAFRRKMGRVYRGLLRGAIVTMARALAAVKAEPDIGPQEVQLMEVP